MSELRVVVDELLRKTSLLVVADDEKREDVPSEIPLSSPSMSTTSLMLLMYQSDSQTIRGLR